MDLVAGTQLLLALVWLLKGAVPAEGEQPILCGNRRRDHEYITGRVFRSAFRLGGKPMEHANAIDVYVGPLMHPMFHCEIGLYNNWCGPSRANRCFCKVSRPIAGSHIGNVSYADSGVHVLWLPQWKGITEECLKFFNMKHGGVVVPSLKINGKVFVIENKECPKLLITRNSTVRFCVTNMLIPTLEILPDGHRARMKNSSGTHCVTMNLPYNKTNHIKKLVLTYKDKCRPTVTITCPVIQRIDLDLLPTSSCYDAYVQRLDFIHLAGRLRLFEANISDFEDTVEVTLGNSKVGYDTPVCTFSIGFGHCARYGWVIGCWCACTSDNRRIIDIHIKLRSYEHSNGKYVKVVWRSTSNTYEDQVYHSPMIQVAVEPRPAMFINGKAHVLMGKECNPQDSGTVLEIIYCTAHEKIYELVIHVGIDKIKVYDGNGVYLCGETNTGVPRTVLTRPFWFTYEPECKLNISNRAYIKSESCKPHAMDNLLALVAIGYLLMTTIQI